MSTFVGMDVEEARALGALLSRTSKLFGRSALMIDSALLRSPWVGSDAAHFREDWSGRLRGQLGQAGASLEAASAQIRQHADEQERASGLGSGPVTAPPGYLPGLPGPAPPLQAMIERTWARY